MRKTWLIRRAVRRPVSLATTSLISSSVCRLPFISSSALPARTSSTALAAAAWLCGTSTSSSCPMSSPNCCATSRILSAGPTRIGTISLASAASTRAAQRALVAGMRHRARDRRDAAGAIQHQPIAVVPLDAGRGQRDRRGRELLGRRDHRGHPVEHGLPVLVDAGAVEQHDPFRRPLLPGGDRHGDRVAAYTGAANRSSCAR